MPTWNRLSSLIRKEFIQITRDPRTLAMTFIMPVAMMFLLGYAATNDVYDLAAQGVTVLVSTHYMDEAEYCTHVGMMRAGKLLALDEPDRLKRALPGQVWELYAEPLLDALDWLEAEPFVLRSTLAGDCLRIVVPQETPPERIRQTLLDHAISLQRMVPGTANMEDVFTALSTPKASAGGG